MLDSATWFLILCLFICCSWLSTTFWSQHVGNVKTQIRQFGYFNEFNLWAPQVWYFKLSQALNILVLLNHWLHVFHWIEDFWRNEEVWSEAKWSNICMSAECMCSRRAVRSSVCYFLLVSVLIFFLVLYAFINVKRLYLIILTGHGFSNLNWSIWQEHHAQWAKCISSCNSHGKWIVAILYGVDFLAFLIRWTRKQLWW